MLDVTMPNGLCMSILVGTATISNTAVGLA